MVSNRHQRAAINSIDFFKTSFWGEPIPDKKINSLIKEKNDIKRDQK
jgi:hypothetical protein